MKKFRLHWLDGKEEIVQGSDIADAFSRAGYGASAIRDIDYYEWLPLYEEYNKPTPGE